MRRNLSREEAALWARVAGTVAPIDPDRVPASPDEGERQSHKVKNTPTRARLGMAPQKSASTPNAATAAADLRSRPHTLDANWDRKLAQGLVAPDFTLDLHGYSLDAAYHRLDHGLALAVSQGARLVLLITGRPRHTEAAGSRGDKRGAIRAKFMDWLALGAHASKIAAIRPAHPRHGGAGAVYLVLRKTR